MTDAPFAPDVAAIAADLADDRLHIDPSLADQVTADQLATIAATVEASPTPIYVLALPLTGETGPSPVQLVTLIHRELPEDGVWFVARPMYDGSWRIESTTYGVSTGNAHHLAGYVADELYPSDLGLQLQKATELMASGTAEEVYYETFPERVSRRGRPPSSPGAPSCWAWDLPVALTGIGVLAIVVAVLVMRRRPGKPAGVMMNERALRRISTAQTQSWRHRAETETAHLGDRVTALEIGAGVGSGGLDRRARPLRGRQPRPRPDHVRCRLDRRARAGPARPRRPGPRDQRTPLAAHGRVLLQPAARSPPTTTARWQTAAGCSRRPCVRRLPSRGPQTPGARLPGPAGR